MKTIIELFDETCKKYNDKTALIYKDIKISFSELYVKVNQMANVFIHLGVQPGDCVSLMLSKRPEFIISYLACIKVGAINVPLNYKLTAQELASPIISTTRPKILICESEFLKKVRELEEKFEFRDILVIDGNAHEYLPLKELQTKVSKEFNYEYTAFSKDIAAIQFTSGTTSTPKGAYWDHSGILAHIEAMASTYKITDKDNWLVLLPSFLSSHNSVILPLFTGSTSILMENSNPQKILQNIEKYNVNIMMSAAVVCLMLLNLTEPDEYNISSLRLVIPGGMRFPLKDILEFEKKFKTNVMDVLAMTEMGIYISNNFESKRYGSLGKPILKVEVKIVDETGKEVPPDTVGEIIAHGPSMFRGYYKLSDETKKVMKDGWFYTGDLGHRDKDGFIYHVSRKSEMINVGGYKIYPQEVEEVLLENEKIEEVALAPVRDSIRGEIPKIFIVLKKGVMCSKTEIIRFCNEKIASYKIPKIVEFCESLPKTGSGKICRKALLGC